MRVSDFDPWKAHAGRGGHAYPAYAAYPEVPLGRIGRIGTASEPQMDRRKELPALQDASEISTIIERCRTRISRSTLSGTSFGALRRQAITFCSTSWPSHLLRLGWNECDLFLCHPGDVSLDGLVQQLEHRRVALATDTCAVLICADGKRVIFDRRRIASDSDEACMIWETEEGRD